MTSPVIAQALSDVPLSVGTMYFGTTVPPDTAHQVLNTAVEAGARFVDTANNYAFWVEGGTGSDSENCLGQWLKTKPARVRDELTIATKVGARPAVTTAGKVTEFFGLSPQAIRAQVTGSLTRLGVERIDVLYAHIDDTTTPLEDTLGAMEELVAEGLVGAIAGSNLTADRLPGTLDAAGRARYAGLQQRFTYLRPNPGADLSPHVLLDEDVEQFCREHGMTMLGYSPLLSGAYTRPDRPIPGGYRGQTAARALAALTDVADAHGLDAGQVVLAWMAQREAPVYPVVGVSTPEQLEAAVEAVTTTLPAQTINALETTRRG